MNIILTDYGVSLLKETGKPIKITEYQLGTGYAYAPSSKQNGLKGKVVYSSSIEGPNVINANVYQYSVFLDYTAGPFFFGEIAYFDSNKKCVAIAVAEEPLEKRAMRNSNSGNSLRLDAYLSMVGGTYNTWADSIGSDIKFQIPVLETIDNLPPVKDSDPNCYIVSPMSEGTSSTLVYSAGNTGLWHFDNYQFNNVRAFSVKSATSTTITLDAKDLSAEEKQDLIPVFSGDKVVEFSSGNCYSICRVVKSVALQSKSVVISFRTPLAIIPEPEDTLLYFSRTQISFDTMRLPIASVDQIGGIRIMENSELKIDDSGYISLSFTPIRTINGKEPDENGNIDIPAYETKVLESNDLNECTTMGVYKVAENVEELLNLPEKGVKQFTLEVIEQGSNVIQRFTNENRAWWRTRIESNWSSWNLIFSQNNHMSVGTF